MLGERDSWDVDRPLGETSLPILKVVMVRVLLFSTALACICIIALFLFSMLLGLYTLDSSPHRLDFLIS
jgi:hypothetical protein